ncbi:unnamed protein product, partial [Meganyctiphanes norvegica]
SHFLLGKGFISKGPPNTSVILKMSMSPCPSGYSSSTVVLPTLGLRQSSSRPVTGPSASSKNRLTALPMQYVWRALSLGSLYTAMYQFPIMSLSGTGGEMLSQNCFNLTLASSIFNA